MNKNLIVVILIFNFLIFSSFLSAQQTTAQQSTAVEIETLLNSKTVTYAQVSRFVLEAANVIAADPQTAYSLAIERNWLSKNVAHDDLARLNNVSQLLMSSFNIKGGIMYSLTNSAHYAYRELVHMGVIFGRHDPAMLVSGENLLFYVNRLLAIQESQGFAESRREAQRLARETVAHSQVLDAEIADNDTPEEITILED